MDISFVRRLWPLATVVAVAFCPLAASGANGHITLPSSIAGIIGAPSEIAFAHHGAMGVVLGGFVSAPMHLVSFTIRDAMVADDLILDDFQVQPLRPTVFGMVVNDETGLVVIFGKGPNETQTVVAVAIDANAKLTKRWGISYPNPNGGLIEASVNADGSIVYAFYYDSSPKLDKIRAKDGVVLGTIQLDDSDFEAGLTFNPTSRRLIIKTTLFFNVLKPEPDFSVDWRAPTPFGFELVKRGFVSADGRFFVAYGGFGFGGEGVASNANNFLSLDLSTREFRILSLESKILPSGVALTFAPDIGRLAVPYSTTVKVRKNGLSRCVCGTQVVDWLSLGPDGTLTRQLTTKLSGDQQVIGPLNNAALSKTSAIAFLATMTKRLVAVDTLTGEVVSDQEVGDVFFIYRVGDTDTFLTTNGTNVLNLLDLDTGPSISSVSLKKHKLIIEGERFLAGVRVEVNGQELGVATRNPDNPGRQITVNSGSKDFPGGESITVIVINRDGLRSKPFTAFL